MPSLLLL